MDLSISVLKRSRREYARKNGSAKVSKRYRRTSPGLTELRGYRLVSIGANRSSSTFSLRSLNRGTSPTDPYTHVGAHRDVAAGTAEFEDHEPISQALGE